jgi:uncharacterized protein
MQTYFLDTGYLIAIEAADDQNHQAALSHWREIIQSPLHIVTTTYIFDEVVTFFNNRNHHAKAVETGNNLLKSEIIEMIQIDAELLGSGWDYFQKHADKRYSLTDCIGSSLWNRES